MKTSGVCMCVALALASCSKRADEMLEASKVKSVADEVVKYAFEAYPMWAQSHPTQECPATVEDLNEYANRHDVTDAWGHPLKMMCGTGMPADAKGIAILSFGPDGKEGTCDDIESWDPKHACKIVATA